MRTNYLIQLSCVCYIVRALAIDSNHLDMSDQNISEIKFNNFLKMNKRIHSFDASNNKILKIKPNLLEHFKILIKFDLSMNRDFDFPENNIFLISQTIEIFKCEHCGITNIYCGTFSGLPQLKGLQLKNNHISRIHPESFQKNINLHSIILDGNKLKTLSEELFGHLKAFTLLSINNNSEYNLKGDELHSQSLTDFSCNFCGFEEITGNTFKNVLNLTKLSLNNNQITCVSTDSFKVNIKLKHIELENNRLKIFTKDLLKIFKALGLNLNILKSIGKTNKLKQDTNTCPNTRKSPTAAKITIPTNKTTGHTIPSIYNLVLENNIPKSQSEDNMEIEFSNNSNLEKKDSIFGMTYIIICIILACIIFQISFCLLLWHWFKRRREIDIREKQRFLFLSF